MGRPLLSSYRYTPIEPVSSSVAVARPSDEAPARSAAAPPKYTPRPPTNLPEYEEVAREPTGYVRFSTTVDTVTELPLGTACQFICHALLVVLFGLFGLLFSWCVGTPSHATRQGRSFGVGLDIIKMAAYLCYYNQIMCWFERRAIPNFYENENSLPVGSDSTSDGMPTADSVDTVVFTDNNGQRLDVVTIDGEQVVNYCSMSDVNPDSHALLPFMWVFGSLIVFYALYQMVLIKRYYKLQKRLNNIVLETE